MPNLKFSKNLALFAAMYNLSALIVFLLPGALPFLGIELPYSSFWLWLPSLLALYNSIVLFFSSRDMARYGSFLYWNGIIRIAFASIAFYLDFKSSVGLFIGIIAIGDMILGLLCVFGTPGSLKKTHIQLLTNS